MSEELQEVKYYEVLDYKGTKAIIRSNINSMAGSFVSIGYYLKHIRDKEMYLEDGYQNIWDLAQAEFGISKSQASKFMSINDKFSKDGNSPILMDRFKDFSSSKLSEMLYLTDEQLEQVTVGTTVAQIREIKKPEEVVSTSKQGCFIKDQINKTGEDELKCSGGISDDCQRCDKADQPKCLTIDDLDLSVSAYNGLHKNGIDTMDKLLECTRQDLIDFRIGDFYTKQIIDRMSENGVSLKPDVTETVEAVPEYIEFVREAEESVIEEENIDFPLSESKKQPYFCPEESVSDEEVEIVEADIILTVPEETETIDPEQYSFQDVKDEHDKLTEYVDTYRKTNEIMPGRRKAKMRLDAITLLGKEMQRPPVVETPKPAQPELPILKNNDQRKEWAENYKAWGEWYYDEHIDCHYYKYDFPNGDRLVVEEYQDRELYWQPGKHDEKYYHLLRKEKQAYGNRRSYEEKYNHSTSSMSEITEYLKDLQKKGA